MSNWLANIFRSPAETLEPKYFSPAYNVFTTSSDEVISSAELIKVEQRRLPGAANVALTDQASLQAALSSEIKSLQVQTTRAAEKIAISMEENLHDTLSLTALIDHSGSMKGDRAQIAAIAATCLSQLAVKLDMPFEVLGFTTKEWRGAPVRRSWTKKGQPPNPGKLCALRHIVYSEFGSSKPLDMTAMFLPNLLKENVDGEAILWAAERAKKSKTSRHLVIVISDGAPVDDSTLAANSADYLWSHFKSVLADLDADKAIILAGVGLDHDLSGSYLINTKLKFFGDIERQFLPFLKELILDHEEN